ncbi:MAG: hypothetical protein EB145_05645, partial [Proteobacteria bacterium]|nr:hypothetical protein [Pseudomonadota bacterium]
MATLELEVAQVALAVGQLFDPGALFDARLELVDGLSGLLGDVVLGALVVEEAEGQFVSGHQFHGGAGHRAPTDAHDRLVAPELGGADQGSAIHRIGAVRIAPAEGVLVELELTVVVEGAEPSEPTAEEPGSVAARDREVGIRPRLPHRRGEGGVVERTHRRVVLLGQGQPVGAGGLLGVVAPRPLGLGEDRRVDQRLRGQGPGTVIHRPEVVLAARNLQESVVQGGRAV